VSGYAVKKRKINEKKEVEGSDPKRKEKRNRKGK
jgi:hypothetical protein